MPPFPQLSPELRLSAPWARLPGALTASPPQRNSSLPDENNVARLQEELKALKVREGEAVASARELKLQLQELSDTWQVRECSERAAAQTPTLAVPWRKASTPGLWAPERRLIADHLPLPRSRRICPEAAAGRSPRGSWSWANCRTS